MHRFGISLFLVGEIEQVYSQGLSQGMLLVAECSLGTSASDSRSARCYKLESITLASQHAGGAVAGDCLSLA